MRHSYAGLDAALPEAAVWSLLAGKLGCTPLEIFGFHAAAICYAQQHRTDGMIDASWVCGTAGTQVTGEAILYAEELVTAGLWIPVGDDSWRILDWTRCNTTRAQWARHVEISQQAGRLSAAARQQTNQLVAASNQLVHPGNQLVENATPAGVAPAKTAESPPQSGVVAETVNGNQLVETLRGGRGGSVPDLVLLLDQVQAQESVQDPLVGTERALQPAGSPGQPAGSSSAVPRYDKQSKATPTDLREIWNLGCGALPKWRGMPAELEKAARARLKELPELDEWRKVVAIVATNAWCLGKNPRGWKAGPVFLLRGLTWHRALNGELDSWAREEAPLTSNARRQQIAQRNSRVAAQDDRMQILTGGDE